MPWQAMRHIRLSIRGMLTTGLKGRREAGLTRYCNCFLINASLFVWLLRIVLQLKSLQAAPLFDPTKEVPSFHGEPKKNC